MTVQDYSDAFDLMFDGAVARYRRTRDKGAFGEPARIIIELQDSLPKSESTKLKQALDTLKLNPSQSVEPLLPLGFCIEAAQK